MILAPTFQEVATKTFRNSLAGVLLLISICLKFSYITLQLAKTSKYGKFNIDYQSQNYAHETQGNKGIFSREQGNKRKFNREQGNMYPPP